MKVESIAHDCEDGKVEVKHFYNDDGTANFSVIRIGPCNAGLKLFLNDEHGVLIFLAKLAQAVEDAHHTPL